MTGDGHVLAPVSHVVEQGGEVAAELSDRHSLGHADKCT
jgi:hypothetical protein